MTLPSQQAGTDKPPRRQSLAAAMGWFAVAYMGAILGYIGVNAIASRLLGTSEFGYFVIAITISTVVGQLALVGVHRGGLRQAAVVRGDDQSGLADLRRGARAVNTITLPFFSLLSGVVAGLIAGGSVTTRLLVGLGMALLVWYGGQQKLYANLLRGFGQLRLASLLEGRSGGALVALSQLTLLAVVYVASPDAGLGTTLVATGVAFALPVGYAAYRVSRRWSHVPLTTGIVDDLRFVAHRDWRFAVIQLGAYLNATVEIWIAGLVLTAPQTSDFSAAQRVALLIVLPMNSIQVVFAPVTSRLVKEGRMPQLEVLLRSGASIAAVVTAVALIPMLVVPGLVLSTIFGAGFASAAPILVILTFGNIMNVVSGMCGTALTMSHNEGLAAAVQWATLGGRVVLGFTAALLWGPVGLAVAASIATVTLFTTMWWSAHRRMGLWTHPTLKPSLRALKGVAG